MTSRLSLLLVLLLAGCTLHPGVVNTGTATVTGNGDGPPIQLADKSWSISKGDKARYDALVGIYGSAKNAAGLPYFLVPIRKGDGLLDGGDRWIIDEEHMIDFGRMAGWYREARKK